MAGCAIKIRQKCVLFSQLGGHDFPFEKEQFFQKTEKLPDFSLFWRCF